MLLTVLLIVLGLALGSFLSAFTFRYPRGLGFVKGRSFCDRCKEEILWYDNIPLFSYLFLLGECRNCHKKISARYPLIELTTAISFVLIGANIWNLTLFLILFSIFIIDLEHQIIPDSLIFLGLGIAFVQFPSLSSLLAGLVCAVLLLLIHLATMGRGMGLGDVKFAVLGGYIVGINLNLTWLFLAFLTGGIIGAILILSRVAKLRQKIAFGPFLVAVIPLTLLYGEKILSWFYLN